jgi:PTH1 family peptidyl-tRNA hydrolase
LTFGGLEGILALLRAVFGLGNPGRHYRETRHNLGFEVVAELCNRADVSLCPGPGSYWWARAVLAGQSVLVICPSTYMNRSGRAVVDVIDREGYDPGEVLVVVDDVNLPLGRLRLRASGSDGGHNGLASVIYELGTEDFPRLRLGVAPEVSPPVETFADFVLARFDEDEREIVKDMAVRAVDAVELILREGFSAAQNAVNRREEDDSLSSTEGR